MNRLQNITNKFNQEIFPKKIIKKKIDEHTTSLTSSCLSIFHSEGQLIICRESVALCAPLSTACFEDRNTRNFPSRLLICIIQIKAIRGSNIKSTGILVQTYLNRGNKALLKPVVKLRTTTPESDLPSLVKGNNILHKMVPDDATKYWQMHSQRPNRPKLFFLFHITTITDRLTLKLQSTNYKVMNHEFKRDAHLAGVFSGSDPSRGQGIA